MSIDAWEKGNLGELVFDEHMKFEGFEIVRHSTFNSDGAPLLEGFRRKLVLPDRMIYRDGHGIWVEVKTKTESVLWRQTNEWRTGCPLRGYNDYREVQTTTGTEVWLAFVHAREQSIFMQSVEILEKSEPGPKNGGRGEGKGPRNSYTVYWNLDVFIKFDLTETPLVAKFLKAHGLLFSNDKK